MAYNPITPSNPLSTSVSDINDAFDKVSKGFAGSTAPSTVEAFSHWLDTSGTDTIKIRNSGNTSWIPLFLFDAQTGPILSDGTDTITLCAPTAIGTSYELKMPADQGGTNQYLKNDGSGNLSWVTLGAGVSALPDLSDVTITSAATGEYLKYSGTAWVDSPLEISDLSTTSAARGDVIIRSASGFQRLGIGGAGTVLSSDGTDVAWSSTAAGLSFTSIDPSSGTTVVADSSTDTLNLTGSTGVTVTGDSSSDTITFTSNDSQINHNGLLNYDSNKHPDVTAGITVTGGWSFANSSASEKFTEFSTLGSSGLHSVMVTGDFVFNRSTNDSRLTTATLSAVRSWTFPDQSGTVTVLGNTITGSDNIVLSTSPTITSGTFAGGTFSSTLTVNDSVAIRFMGASHYVGLQAPSSNSASYNLTLPDESELPSTGKRYLQVDSSGTLSFTTGS